jgi:hypothetical protein
MPGRFVSGIVGDEESAWRKGESSMDARLRLAVVREQAAALGREVMANEGWLTGGFLSDARFTPEAYLDVAERQRTLQRMLFALTECLLSETTPPVVA